MNPRALITFLPQRNLTFPLLIMLLLVKGPIQLDASPMSSLEIGGAKTSQVATKDQPATKNIQVLSVAGFVPETITSNNILSAPVDQQALKVAVVEDISSVAPSNLEEIKAVPGLPQLPALDSLQEASKQPSKDSNIDKLKRGLNSFINNNHPFFIAASAVVAERSPASSIVTSKVGGAESSAATIVNGDPTNDLLIKGHNRLGRQARPLGGPLRWGR